MSKHPTHPADGLYYVTTAMLRKIGACNEQVSLFKQATGGYMEVTLENMYQLNDAFFAFRSIGPQLAAGVSLAQKHGKFTQDECDDYGRGYRFGTLSPHPPSNLNASRFMDLLLRRAKREGLVRS